MRRGDGHGVPFDTQRRATAPFLSSARYFDGGVQEAIRTPGSRPTVRAGQGSGVWGNAQ